MPGPGLPRHLPRHGRAAALAGLIDLRLLERDLVLPTGLIVLGIGVLLTLMTGRDTGDEPSGAPSAPRTDERGRGAVVDHDGPNPGDEIRDATARTRDGSGPADDVR